MGGDGDGNLMRLSTHGLAEHFGVHVRTVRLWIATGKIVAKKDPGGRRWVIYVNFPRNQAATTESTESTT